MRWRYVFALFAVGSIAAAGNARAEMKEALTGPQMTGVVPVVEPEGEPPAPIGPIGGSSPAPTPPDAVPTPVMPEVVPIAQTTVTEPPEGTMVPEQNGPYVVAAEPRYVPSSGVGLALMAGGGVSDYVGTTMRSNTGTAGSWDVRAVFGTRSFLAVEAAYVGAAQSITGAGYGPNADLVRNGAEGVLRLQAPIARYSGLVEPYVFGGVGWNHYSITDSNSTGSKTSDEVLTVPFGAGLGAGYRGFIADVRFTYRPTYYQNLFTTGGDHGLTNWNVGAAIGLEF